MLYHTYRDLGDDDAVWSFQPQSVTVTAISWTGWNAGTTPDQLRDAVEEAMGVWDVVDAAHVLRAARLRAVARRLLG